MYHGAIGALKDAHLNMYITNRQFSQQRSTRDGHLSSNFPARAVPRVVDRSGKSGKMYDDSTNLVSMIIGVQFISWGLRQQVYGLGYYLRCLALTKITKAEV